MSKTTKIIAALGVVAGLGVAALPAFTYAAEVSGDVDVIVEVEPAIAMRIVGNNDTASGYGNVKIKSDDINTIGSQDVSDFVTTGAATSSSKYQVLPYSVLNGNDTNGFKSTITVYTNAGYYGLSIKDADSTLDLVNGSSVIPAGVPGSGDTTFDLTAGTPAWGYVVDTASTDGTGYSPITASDVEIKHEVAVAAGNSTVVYYGAATSATQATGNYVDTLTYTAVSANS